MYRRCGLSRRPPGSGKRKFCLLFVLSLAVGIVFLEFRLKPVARELAAHEASVLFIEAVGEAVDGVLQEENISYEDLVHILRDDGGSVLSVSSDVVQMNRLKAEVLQRTQENLDQMGGREIWIPLGTLCGGELFRGRGPKVPLRITLSGAVTADFSNTYTSAGINQTCHRISLQVNGEIYTYISGTQATVPVDWDIAVAETIIVGETPQFFAGTSLENS